MKPNVEFQEPDRKKKIKRLIARYGLILLGCIFSGVVIIGLTKLAYHLFYLLTKPRLYDDLLIFEPFSSIKKIGLLMMIFGCSFIIYLLVIFVIWAVRTLRER